MKMENKIPDTFMVSCAILCKKEGMAEYFKVRCENFVLITVIPKYSKDQKPKCEVFKNGKQVKSFNLITIPDFISNKSKYFVHLGYIFSIIYAAFKLRKRFELFIGEGHIYTSAGLILKSFGFFKKIIYSSGDYFVDVKSFQIIDKFLNKHVDAIWSASDRMCKERLKNAGEMKAKGIQLTMPLGVEMKRKIIKNNRLKTKNVLFIGNIQEHQGLDLFIDSMQKLIKLFPDIKLEVIGTGMHQNNIKKKVSKLNLVDYVTFHGFIECQDKTDEIFSKCVCGIALYIPELSGFTKLSDPGKIKDYLSAGLPVITTKVFNFSKEIKKCEAGEVIDYKEDQLIEAISKIIKNQSTLKTYSNKAVKLAEKYEWDKILNRVYTGTNSFWEKS